MSIKGYEATIDIVPHERQIEWQKNEFYGMISYGMNTFTGVQWGDGFAPAERFWPEDIDVESWAETAKNSGMSALILTAKHIDGFCLWPTEYTDYSVKSCKNWQEGNGDIVRDLSLACRKFGLKFGVYLSLWDKHERSYGNGRAYDDFFCGLLTELLSNYGDIFCVWLEPLVGEGINHKVQEFDLPRYYKLIRELQPDCVISALGPDVRWCGNFRGVTRKSEWSVIPSYLGVSESGKENDIKSKKPLDRMALDLGGRRAIKNEDSFIWYPLELSVPMREGWFYNKNDDYSVKTKDKLLKLYYGSVGANSALLLGLAPDKRGRLHDTDVQILTALGKDLQLNFIYNLLTEKLKAIKPSSELSELYKVANLCKKGEEGFWRPAPDDKKPEIIIEFTEPDLFDKVVIQENIRNGQHIEEFEIYYKNEKDKWRLIYEGTVVGYKAICHFKPVKSDSVKIVFTKYRSFIELSHIMIN